MAKKKGRRARGTGSIFFNSRRGLWVGRVPVGRTAAGKTHYVERSAPTQAEVVALMRSAAPPAADTTLSEWSRRWLDNLTVRPATLDSYRSSFTHHVIPSLGALPVRSLSAHQIESAARNWPVAANSARLVLAHLGVCLNAAVRAGLIPSSPVKLARRPKGTRKAITPFTPGELARIIAEATRKPATRFLAVLAATGARIGEVLALDCPDVSIPSGTIRITKTQPNRAGRKPGPPKSPNSVRTIRVPTQALPALTAAVAGRRSGPVFRTRTGRRLSQSGVRPVWVALLDRLGLPYRSPHKTRHSVASALIAAGEPLADVAAYLGDDVATLVKTYLRPVGTDPAKLMERLLGS